MSINETKGIGSIGPVAPAPGNPAARRARAAVEASAQRETVTVASQQASAGRTARFKQLESAIRNGQYRPSPSELADHLLDSAELDARLRALLKG